jgi:hypothetical protein
MKLTLIFKISALVVPMLTAITLTVLSENANAALPQHRRECAVMENRGDYIATAARFGFTRSVISVENPFLALTRAPQTTEQSRVLLHNELDRMGYAQALVPSIPASEVKLAQENIGLQMVRETKGARLALTYGSLRTKGNGSIRIIYSLQDVRTGTQNQKMLEITREETQKILGALCKVRGCNAEAIMANPSVFESAAKAIVGVKMAKVLPQNCRM